MSAVRKIYVSESDYLVAEDKAEHRHEYINGEVVAMAGASVNHVQITLNIPLALAAALYANACDIYTTDIRVKVAPTGAIFYPDVVIVCGGKEIQEQHGETLLNPTIIVEVLSESTAAYDRGVKWAHYQKSNTLKEYLLVSQTHPYVEHYIRQPDGTWRYLSYEGLETSIHFPSVSLEITMAALYQRVIFET